MSEEQSPIFESIITDAIKEAGGKQLDDGSLAFEIKTDTTTQNGQISERGNVIDPLTGQVITEYEIPLPDYTGNENSTRIIDEIYNISGDVFGETLDYLQRQGLDFSNPEDILDYYNKFPDAREFIEAVVKKEFPNINISSTALGDIASGFITGDFPGYLGLDGLDGLGIKPLFDGVSKAIQGVNNYVESKI
jgi:hypothetical protein